MTEALKIPSYVKPALARLKTGDVIVCQLSQSEEAIDGYLHFTASDSRKMGGATFRWLKQQGLIVASGDGLLPECPQTYQVIRHDA